MSIPARKVPLTPLDALRALLGEFAEGEPTFAGRLQQTLGKLRKQALPELGARLASPGAPRGLRKAILGCVAKHDWPEWVPWIHRALQAEPDLGIFDEGCAALGALGTRDALEALKALQAQRDTPDHQTILARELGQFQPQQSVSYYLSRLLEGQGNPRLAAQGAKLLAALAGEGDLPAIAETFREGDPLTRRLALRLLGSLPYPGVQAYLLDLGERTRQDILDHQLLLEQVNRLHAMPRASALPELVRQAAVQFEERDARAIASLKQAAAQEDGNPGPALEALRLVASGVFEQFLLDALALVSEGKVARYQAMLSEAGQGAEQRLGELLGQCDLVAETLAAQAEAGNLETGRVLPLFAAILRSRAGGDGFIQAYLRMLPSGETGILDELLADPDMARRERYLNALGGREDDALTPFFVKAMEDPIVELGQLASHHLGKLPSSFQVLMGMFTSGSIDQVRQAISVFRENRVLAAAQPLLEFLTGEGHDALLVDATDAIAAIGYQASTPTLLELLHDGKPLNLQIALARALKSMRTAEASLGLLAKAPALKQPQVLILALEGALAGFPGFDHPLPLEQLPGFLQLVERCCDEREGEGQRLRAIFASQDLYVFERQAYDRLKDRFSDYLFDMRTKEAWDRDSNDRVAAVVKELARRSESLGLLAQKEAGIQAQVQRLPASGPKRVEALLALRESLQDPALILRPEVAQGLALLVQDLLRAGAAEWRETAHLCEIGGISGRADLLLEPIRDIFQRATGLGLKSAARSALLALGLAEEDLNRRGPVRSILLLEPSGFFRKRLAGQLAGQGTWELEEASGRAEAQAVLERRQVDLVLTETKDAEGDLAPWLFQHWGSARFRYAIVSTSNRDLGELAAAPWVVATLFKPYATEQVLQALEP